MSRLVIVGAGGFGRELYQAVEDSPEFRRSLDIDTVGFIDDNPAPDLIRGPRFGGISDFVPEPGDLGLCALGRTAVRKKVVASLEERGLHFPAFVDDRAMVGASVELADGVVICARTFITADVTIGRHTQINSGCSIGHDVTIGEFVTMSSGIHLTGGVTVESEAWLATGVIVIPGRTIGAGAMAGAGSVVIRNVKPGTTVFGNPAKKL
ncbi:MAG: NeuD/PglB/VioB family sugar acetyltransferase [Propionibacteriaceae bacterium]|nr:NeuD/PglB/VioB family sugar acetyltransferase [Propionibacteriaceae bacterium]